MSIPGHAHTHTHTPFSLSTFHVFYPCLYFFLSQTVSRSVFCFSQTVQGLTHAERVRVRLAGSDLHLAFQVFGARMTGLGEAALLGEASRQTVQALRVGHGSTGSVHPPATVTHGARCTQTLPAVAPQVEAFLAVTVCVLNGRAGGQLRDAGHTAGAGQAGLQAI